MNRRTIRFTAVLGAEAAALLLLHHLGSLEFFDITWTELFEPATRLDDAVASGLRFVALGLGYWLATSTVLYGGAYLTNAGSALKAASWVTLPIFRRVIDRMLAVGLTAGIVTTPAASLAQSIPPGELPETIYQPTPAGQPSAVDHPVVILDEGVILPPGATVPTEPVEAAPPSLPPIGTQPVASTQPTPSAEHIVVTGENLWTIAAAHLETTLERPALNPEIAEYWVNLMAVNSTRISSGDPDLIYPGEILVLPPSP